MSYLEKYNQWKNATLTHELIDQLEEYSEDEIKDAFSSDLDFGTGGLRGLMGPGTNRVNIYTIRRATQGYANYLKKQNLLDGVAISYDNRHNSHLFAHEAARVLAANNIKSYIFSELRPTPLLSFAVRFLNLSGGIMITASHNPKEYNGYKVYNKDGAQLNLKESEAVIKEINKIEELFLIQAKQNELINYIDDIVETNYLNHIKAISLRKKSSNLIITYSPLHGTGGTIIPKFLKNEGYHVFPVEKQMFPDTEFTYTKSSNPEEALAFVESIIYAKEITADLLLVTDPDADRLGVGCYNNGRYQLLNGNETAAIELYYILSNLKDLNLLPKDGYVFSTVVTTPLIIEIAKSFGMKPVQTLTGFKFIGEQIGLIENKGTYVFGCEESYGSLIADFVRDKDAVQACYLLAEIASNLKVRGMNLFDYLNEIYKQYGYHHEMTHNISLLEYKEGKLDQIMEYFRNNDLSIDGKELLFKEDYLVQKRFIGKKKQSLDLPKSNVVKYVYSDDSWVVLRPSGTEPKLKIYFGVKSDKSLENAKAECEKLKNYVISLAEGI